MGKGSNAVTPEGGTNLCRSKATLQSIPAVCKNNFLTPGYGWGIRVWSATGAIRRSAFAPSVLEGKPKHESPHAVESEELRSDGIHPDPAKDRGPSRRVDSYTFNLAAGAIRLTEGLS